MESLDEKVIERIKKLAAMADPKSGASEAEMAMAASKMQELLEAHNLDMSVIGSSGKGAQKRTDSTGKGGLYSWQRKLWQGVAELNFCVYFSIKGLAKGSVYEHRLVGSHGNVIATQVMADYLQRAIEGNAQKWAYANFYKSVFVREAIAYREGMAARVVEKLAERRRKVLEEERIRTEERKRDEAMRGAQSTSNALTLVEYISSEQDFNNDYLNGWDLGTTAKNRHEQEKRMAAFRAEQARKQAEYEAWKKANPEEAARQEKAAAEALANQYAKWAKEDAAAERRRNKTPPKMRYRRATPEEERQALGSYSEGYRAGNDVGIDQQVKAKDQARRIG